MYKLIEKEEDIISGRNYLRINRNYIGHKYIKFGDICIYVKHVLGNTVLRYSISGKYRNRDIIYNLEDFNKHQNFYTYDIKKSMKAANPIYEIESKEDIDEIISKELMLCELRK